MSTDSPSSAAIVRDTLTLTAVTWNILSPSYFRLLDRSDKKKRMEASHAAVWEARLRQQCAVLASLRADVVGLQELWLKPGVQAVVDELLAPRFDVFAVRRTGGKEDAVALLVDRSRWRVVERRAVEFDDAGDRVAAVALLEPAAGGARVVVAVTHLTYPHPGDEALRVAQAVAVDAAVKAAAAAWGAAAAPALLLGDLNGDERDDAVASLLRAGWASAFGAVAGREAAVTHVTHDGRQAGVDFVLFAPGVGGGGGAAGGGAGRRLVPTRAAVLPELAGDGATLGRPVVQRASDVAAAAAAAAATAAAGGAAGAAAAGRVPPGSTAVLAAPPSPPTPQVPGVGGGGATAPYAGRFAVTRRPSTLDLDDWTDLSDHRPVLAEFAVESEPGRIRSGSGMLRDR